MAASAASIWAPAPPEHWYLTDDFNMPVTADTQRRENTLQSVFEAHVARRGLEASILANVALRWDQAHPGVGVDPDIMWLEPALPEGRRSVLTWEEGTGVPRLAVEVVGRDTAHKDYNHGPGKYAASGIAELWVFDPEGFGRRDDGDGPHVLQIWRRSRGGFQRVYAGPGPARTEVLDAWLVVADDVLRVADDRDGRALWPTVAEERDHAAQERDRAARERDLAAQERDRAARERDLAAQERDRERARAEAAEARIRELEARLAKG
jgi:hypothetical protein